MNTIKVNCCRKCPYFQGSDKEYASCGHSDAPKSYDGIVPRSHFRPEPIPKWCPIKNEHIIVKRDSNDNIVSKTKIIFEL